MIVKIIRANWNLERDNGDVFHGLGLRITTGRWRKKTRVVGIYGFGNKWFYDADEPNVGDPFELTEEIKKAIHAARKANLGPKLPKLPKQIKVATAAGKGMFSGNLLPAFSDTDEPIEGMDGDPGVVEESPEEPEEEVLEAIEKKRVGKPHSEPSTRFEDDIKAQFFDTLSRVPLPKGAYADAARRAHEAGNSISDIAKAFGRSKLWVKRAIKGGTEEQLDAFPGETEIDKVIRLGKEHDAKVISTMLGISWIRVKGILSGKIKEPVIENPCGEIATEKPCGEIALGSPQLCVLGSLVRGGFATFTDAITGHTQIVVILETDAEGSHVSFENGTLFVGNSTLNGYYPQTPTEQKELMEKLWPKSMDHKKQWKQWDGRILDFADIGDDHLDRIITMLGSGNFGHCKDPMEYRKNAITHRLWRKENDIKVADDLRNYAMYRADRGCPVDSRSDWSRLDYGSIAPLDEED